jgi:hypothetical protein
MDLMQEEVRQLRADVVVVSELAAAARDTFTAARASSFSQCQAIADTVQCARDMAGEPPKDVAEVLAALTAFQVEMLVPMDEGRSVGGGGGDSGGGDGPPEGGGGSPQVPVGTGTGTQAVGLAAPEADTGTGASVRELAGRRGQACVPPSAARKGGLGWHLHPTAFLRLSLSPLRVCVCGLACSL